MSLCVHCAVLFLFTYTRTYIHSSMYACLYGYISAFNTSIHYIFTRHLHTRYIHTLHPSTNIHTSMIDFIHTTIHPYIIHTSIRPNIIIHTYINPYNHTYIPTHYLPTHLHSFIRTHTYVHACYISPSIHTHIHKTYLHARMHSFMSQSKHGPRHCSIAAGALSSRSMIRCQKH